MSESAGGHFGLDLCGEVAGEVAVNDSVRDRTPPATRTTGFAATSSSIITSEDVMG